jgi:hypothetical protein
MGFQEIVVVIIVGAFLLAALTLVLLSQRHSALREFITDFLGMARAILSKTLLLIVCLGCVALFLLLLDGDFIPVIGWLDDLLLSTDAKTNLYLSHERLSIDAGCSGRGARKYKNDCAQALIWAGRVSVGPGAVQAHETGELRSVR